MAFPTTAVLDTFNRANGALGANWTGDPMAIGAAVHSITSNAATGGEHSYWNAATYGESEAYVTVSTLVGGFVAFYMRIQTPGSGACDAYEITWTTGGVIKAEGVINAYSSNPLIGSSSGHTALASGYKFGARVTGSGTTVTIECWIDTGSGWTLADTFTDSSATRITSAGYIGMLSNASDVLDDFGGGTYVPPRKYILSTPVS